MWSQMLFSTVELIFDSNNELLTSLREEMSNTHKPEPMLGEVFLHNTEKLAQFYGVFCNHQKGVYCRISIIIIIRQT